MESVHYTTNFILTLYVPLEFALFLTIMPITFTPFNESSKARQELASGTGSKRFRATSNASGWGLPFLTSGSDEQQTMNWNMSNSSSWPARFSVML